MRASNAGLTVTAALAAAVCGCVRAGMGVGKQTGASPDVGPVSDASSEVERLSDASSDTLGFGPFGAAKRLPGIDKTGDDPTLTDDMLQVIFENDSDLWGASRGAKSEGFSPPLKLAVLNSAEQESTPEMSYDGLSLYFASARTGTRTIYRSFRASRDDDWSTPTLVSELQWSGGDASVVPMATRGPWMVGVREVAANNTDLYLSQNVEGQWSPFRPLEEINSPGTDSGGFLATDKEIWFHSDRTGTREIYRAVRSGITSPFSTPQPIAELDLADMQYDPWLSSDRRTIVFVSRHEGSRWIYYATR